MSIDLDQLAALEQAATPGPWRAAEGDLEGKSLAEYNATLLANREKDGTTTGRLFLTLAPNVVDPEFGAEVVPAMTGDGPAAEANAALIVAMRNALPELIERVQEAETERDALKESGLQVPVPDESMGITSKRKFDRVVQFLREHRGSWFVVREGQLVHTTHMVKRYPDCEFVTRGPQGGPFTTYGRCTPETWLEREDPL